MKQVDLNSSTYGLKEEVGLYCIKCDKPLRNLESTLCNSCESKEILSEIREGLKKLGYSDLNFIRSSINCCLRTEG